MNIQPIQNNNMTLSYNEQVVRDLIFRVSTVVGVRILSAKLKDIASYMHKEGVYTSDMNTLFVHMERDVPKVIKVLEKVGEMLEQCVSTLDPTIEVQKQEATIQNILRSHNLTDMPRATTCMTKDILKVVLPESDPLFVRINHILSQFLHSKEGMDTGPSVGEVLIARGILQPQAFDTHSREK